MKKIIVTCSIIANTIFADQFTSGHFKKNGTYVKGHMKSSPNATVIDNFSTYGNKNPYTGKAGTKHYNFGSYKGNNIYKNSYKTLKK